MSIQSNYLGKSKHEHKNLPNDENLMNKTITYLSNINKLRENNMMIPKSRFNLIRKEKDRLASLQKESNNKKSNSKINKKDAIYDDLAILFGRISEVKDDSISSSSYVPGSILSSRKNMLSKHNSLGDIMKNKGTLIKDSYNDKPPSKLSNELRNDIFQKTKNNHSQSNSNKKIFNTEILNYNNFKVQKKDSNKLLESNTIKTHFPQINLRISNQSNINSFKNKTYIQIKRGLDLKTQMLLKPKYKTSVKFQNFPQNFPVFKKNQFENIKLNDIFSVLKVYKAEFKF